jgi:hypothetical protein
VIRALTEKYSKVRLRLSSELTGELINRLLAGELDVCRRPRFLAKPSARRTKGVIPLDGA